MNKLYFSAYQQTERAEINFRNHKSVVRRLNLSGIKCRVGKGIYKGEAEICIEVDFNSSNLKLVQSFCQQFKQESFLIVDGIKAKVVSCSNGLNLAVGTWTKIVDPTGLEGWTEIGTGLERFTIA